MCGHPVEATQTRQIVMQAAAGRRCSTASDLWSMGCILAEMALQRPLFPCHSPAELLRQIADVLRPRPGPAAGPDARSPSSVAAARTGAARSASAALQSPATASRGPGGDAVRSWLDGASPLHLELARVRGCLTIALTQAVAQRVCQR